MAQPGVMVYFDIRPALAEMTAEDKGRLFEAILDYGEFKLAPDFSDSAVLRVAWAFVAKAVDKDAAQYDEKVKQKRHAVYSREAKKKGETPMSYDEWLVADANHMISNDIDRYPTTTTPSTTTAPSTPTPTPTPNTTAFSTANSTAAEDIKTAAAMPAGFDMFWEKFPNKVCMRDALDAWKDICITEGTAALILAGLDRWNNSLEWGKEDGRYIPRPAKWLRDLRWQEYPKEKIPMGATGHLGQAELEAIQRILKEDQ